MNEDINYNIDLDTVEARVTCSCGCNMDNSDDMTREDLLKQIKSYNFAIIELRFIS